MFQTMKVPPVRQHEDPPKNHPTSTMCGLDLLNSLFYCEKSLENGLVCWLGVLM